MRARRKCLFWVASRHGLSSATGELVLSILLVALVNGILIGVQLIEIQRH
jgi:hypothetical protein